MKKTIEIKVRNTTETIRKVEIKFPIYVKRSYPTYDGDTYIKYEEGETEYLDKIFALCLPKDPDSEYAMSYFGIDEDSMYLREGYKYALRNGTPEKKDYYEIITQEQYLAAFELYKTNFLNKI